MTRQPFPGAAQPCSVSLRQTCSKDTKLGTKLLYPALDWMDAGLLLKTQGGLPKPCVKAEEASRGSRKGCCCPPLTSWEMPSRGASCWLQGRAGLPPAYTCSGCQWPHHTPSVQELCPCVTDGLALYQACLVLRHPFTTQLNWCLWGAGPLSSSNLVLEPGPTAPPARAHQHVSPIKPFQCCKKDSTFHPIPCLQQQGEQEQDEPKHHLGMSPTGGTGQWGLWPSTPDWLRGS